MIPNITSPCVVQNSLDEKCRQQGLLVQQNQILEPLETRQIRRHCGDDESFERLIRKNLSVWINSWSSAIGETFDETNFGSTITLEKKWSISLPFVSEILFLITFGTEILWQYQITFAERLGLKSRWLLWSLGALRDMNHTLQLCHLLAMGTLQGCNSGRKGWSFWAIAQSNEILYPWSATIQSKEKRYLLSRGQMSTESTTGYASGTNSERFRGIAFLLPPGNDPKEPWSMWFSSNRLHLWIA